MQPLAAVIGFLVVVAAGSFAAADETPPPSPEPPASTAPPPTAPPASTAAPPPSGPPAASAVQSVPPQDAEAILGQRVSDSEGKDIGRLVDVLVGSSGQPQAAVIDF